MSKRRDPPVRRHRLKEIGYTVDVANLLFTPQRDYIATKDGKKVLKAGDLEDKTVVLFICPLNDPAVRRGMGDALDMSEAYEALLRKGSDVEFVCVPVPCFSDCCPDELWFHYLHDFLPFPVVPFRDIHTCGRPIMETFSVDKYDCLVGCVYLSSYWVVIDPTQTVVATRFRCDNIFKLFTGEELYPLSGERITALIKDYKSQSREQLVSMWNQLMASPTRDFLLSSNGDKVPIASLKRRKVVGLYFCENMLHPPRMKAIQKVYEDAKSRGHDFEIVQITFHFYCCHASYLGAAADMSDMSVKNCTEEVSWLTLPFKDPSCRKLQRIFGWTDRSEKDPDWQRGCLVLVHPGLWDGDHALSEFSGAEILEQWGIEGYPFTRQSLYITEYEVQKRELTLRALFPPTEVFLRREARGSNFYQVNAYQQLLGKRVLIVFCEQSDRSSRGAELLSMLKSKYDANKFEVVYVALNHRTSFESDTKDMPWLVCPNRRLENGALYCKIFKVTALPPAAAAFNEDGELIAKQQVLNPANFAELEFPLIDEDLEGCIRTETTLLIDKSKRFA